MRSLPLFPRAAVALACALVLTHGAYAQALAQAAPTVVAARSPMDAQLFYQVLIGEMELRTGQPGTAFQVLLDAARKTRDESLFRRATEVALQQRAGDSALVATQAWRTALPESLDAVRYQLQLLIGLNRAGDTVEPARTLLKLTPAAERAAVISSLPRLFDRNTDKAQAAAQLEKVLQPSLSTPETRVVAQVAMGRAWLAASDAPKALALAQSAHALSASFCTAAISKMRTTRLRRSMSALHVSNLSA